MNTARWGLISGSAAGAAAMFLLDPALGRRRRTLVRDQLRHAARKSRTVVRPTAADVYNRAYGTVAATKSRFQSEAPVSNTKLVARVRSELGRVVSHPRALDVTVSEGCVTLSGPILAEEESRAIKHVTRVRGVSGIVNSLEVHDGPDNVPALQGGKRRTVLPDFAQARWAPTSRLVSSLIGAFLGLYGARRRGLRGLALGALGVGLFTRAATNTETMRLADAGKEKVLSVGMPRVESFADTAAPPQP
jgi:hypothetical protein